MNANALCSSDPSSWCSTSELPAGAHLGTRRGGYIHHGIYLGGGRVVHYAGLAHGWRRGPVEVVSLEEFTRGRTAWVINDQSQRFSSDEVVRRAMSRVGENRYHVLTNKLRALL